MKKVVFLNSVGYGSTGKIVFSLSNICKENGYDSYVCLPKGRHNKNKGDILFGNRFIEDSHIILSMITGRIGCYSYFATKSLIRKLKKIEPDILHLHNLHNSYVNITLLFKYIKANNVKVVWTLHDCWSFTGHCAHFSMAKCNKWKIGCYNCPSFTEYPKSIFDNSKKMYKLKKTWFTGVENMTLVSPSQWLANLVKQSFMKDYPIKVINNGIDLSVFRPTENSFRKEYNISSDKHILLGVAFGWGKKKGIDVFIELARRLSEKYKIVLVGTDENIDKQLPSNIMSIHRTQNQKELADIYGAADLFINPTREEVLGLVNVEALACGTPVITFNTGGSPECIDDNCGSIVECDDIDELVCKIIHICKNKPYSKEKCLERAKMFDMNERYKEYLDLYEGIING